MASYPFRFWLKEGHGFGLTGTGPAPTDDLTLPTKDSVFSAQLIKPDPTALDAEALMVGKICETHHYASSVHRTLLSTGVLTAQGHPDTTKIDRSLVSKIAIISVPKCRELVNMLFWWEEELTRWRLLDEEIAEVQGDGERVAVLQAKKRVLPSMRRADGKIHGENTNPPEYRA